jgi:hypothetical protein
MHTFANTNGYMQTAATLTELREDFLRRRKGCLSLPITGCIVWSLAAIASFVVPAKAANLTLIGCYFLLFPIAVAIARLRGEDMRGGDENPLLRLAALCRLMVFLLWAVLLPIFFLAPALFPLAMAIGFGLHWIVFSWTVGHSIGVIHATLRTALVLAAWFLFPRNQMGAVASVTALTYLLSIWQLRRIYPAPHSLDRSDLQPKG